MARFLRYEQIRNQLMPQALEVERKCRKAKAWTVLLWVMVAGIYSGSTIFLTSFSIFVYHLTFVHQEWFLITAAVFAALLFTAALATGSASKNYIIGDLTLSETESIGPPNIWKELPVIGRVLMVIFGALIGLSIATVFLVVLYKILF